MKNLLFAFITYFLLPAAYCQDTSICYLRDPGGRIREHNVDFIKMVLDVKFKPRDGKVSGNVKYDFKPIQYIVDTLFLNAPDIAIKKVLLNGAETKFTTDSFGVTIKFLPGLDWNKQYKLDITYEATPRKGLYFIGWNVDAKNPNNDRYFTRKQIWTQGQGIDNRHWIPCYDDVNDKMVTETKITFDTLYTVISNGALKEKKRNTDGTFTWHYAMDKPMVPYLIMIGIDKYAYKDYKSKFGVTSRQYYYADHPENVDPSYQYSSEMMDWMVSEFGVKYPWQTYANIPVQDFMYGAMENTTATIYGDFYLTDKHSVLDRPYYGTNAHELTHQWFGDYITEYSAQHHWLHESFATYYAKQFLRTRFGEDYYNASRRGEANTAIAADRNDRFPVASSRGGSARHYPKGSFVIDMLRYTVGDSVYKRCITNYLKKHAYGNVSNHDFMMAFMETAGINLDWFFDQWIYRAGIPNFEVSYERIGAQVRYIVKQTHKTDELTGYFKMPVVFQVHFKDGSSSAARQWVSQAVDTIYVNAPVAQEIDYVLFDAGAHILKTVTFTKPFEELKAQALKATQVLDRYDALIAMQNTDMETKRDFLITKFNKGDFNWVQMEIISQLSKDSSSASIETLRKALQDKDFQVRRAVIDNMATIPQTLLPDAEKLLTDTSYVSIENTLRKLVRQYPANAERYLETTKTMRGMSNNIRITWLELKLKTYATISGDSAKPYIRELADYSSNKYEFRTRLKAMDALEHLQYADDEIIRNLFNASLYTNGRLSGPASRTLKSLLKKSETLELAKTIAAQMEWKNWEKPVIDKLLQ